VARDSASGAYALGPRAAGLAREEPVLARLRAIAWPTLRAVRNATGARAAASTVSEAHDLRIEAAALDNEAEEAALAGCAPPTMPLHAGASSKALLAQLPSREIRALIDAELATVGPATITDAARLWREVRAIKRRGWAFSSEEVVSGTWALAVPVPVSAAPRGACSLAIGGALSDFDRTRARRQAAALTLAARALAVRLRDEGRDPRATRDDAHGPDIGRGLLHEIERGEARWQTA
jgi:DNA-binding IclR family transcriptional regulator